MYRHRFAALVLALAGLGGLAVPAATVSASTTVPTLTQIRAAHHPGYDRLVFNFRGPLPAHRTARYVSQVIGGFSGLPVPVTGNARLLVRFDPAAGHNANGRTYGPAQRSYALPNLIQVVNAGDFESTLSFGVGLARREPFRMFTLTNPSRVVIEVQTPYRTVSVRDYFLNSHRFATGLTPYTQPVSRPVIPPAAAFGALQRLFAGPTQAERALGLRFVASQATGFKNLRIKDGVARVQLTGGCSSGGSTFTVANEIRPTLKQFPSVHWVKIYDPSGHTERPYGHTDSIPQGLEP
jgi:Sporulation and spore germination